MPAPWKTTWESGNNPTISVSLTSPTGSKAEHDDEVEKMQLQFRPNLGTT